MNFVLGNQVISKDSLLYFFLFEISLMKLPMIKFSSSENFKIVKRFLALVQSQLTSMTDVYK